MSEENGLPRGWLWAELGKLCAFINGDRGKNYPSRDSFVPSGIPFINAGHLEDGQVNFSEMNYISERRFNLLGSGKIQADDVLYCLRGSLGKAAVVNGVASGAVASSLVILRSLASLCPKYLYYFLIGPLGKAEIFRYDNGSAQPNLSARNVKSYRVPLAPLDEQRRIVAKVEELFSDLDAAVAALKRAKANLKNYRAAVLKAAVEGKLTAEWRAKHPTEPASKLLERILAERRRKWEADQLAKFAAAGKEPPKNWKAKYVEPKAPDTSGLPELPVGWCCASIDQLSVVVRGASPRPAGDPRFFGGPIPWITVGSLTAHDDPFLGSVSEGLTAEGKEASRWIDAGTLLLTNSGATLGVPKITRIGGCINDGSVALLYVEEPMQLYLYYFLRSETDHLRAINQGAAQPNLNTGLVKAIVAPLCSAAEQCRIVSEVETRLSQIKAAENEITRSMLRAGRLRQSILKQAFEGKLVPQDPSDEPASGLLARLRATQVTHEGNGKTDAPVRTRGRRQKSSMTKGKADE